MDPFKIIGGLLILLGVVFRAVSIAYFNLRAKTLPDDPKAQRLYAGKKRRALAIDYAFIILGAYTIVTH